MRLTFTDETCYYQFSSGMKLPVTYNKLARLLIDLVALCDKKRTLIERYES